MNEKGEKEHVEKRHKDMKEKKKKKKKKKRREDKPFDAKKGSIRTRAMSWREPRGSCSKSLKEVKIKNIVS
jgi:hypothetical protein